MSIQAIAAVLECRDAPGLSSGMVLIAIANRCDEDWRSWPSYERIALEAKVDRRTARRIVKKLEAAGWIKVLRGEGPKGRTGRPTNVYVVNRERLLMGGESPVSNGGQMPPLADGNGGRIASNGGLGGHVMGVPRPPESSLEPSDIEPKEASDAVASSANGRKKVDLDEMFNALAEFEGVDLSPLRSDPPGHLMLMRGQAARIAKARADILAVTPDLDPAELFAVCRVGSRAGFRLPTAVAIAKHWTGLLAETRKQRKVAATFERERDQGETEWDRKMRELDEREKALEEPIRS